MTTSRTMRRGIVGFAAGLLISGGLGLAGLAAGVAHAELSPLPLGGPPGCVDPDGTGCAAASAPAPQGAVPAPPPAAAPAAVETPRSPNRTCEILAYGDPDC